MAPSSTCTPCHTLRSISIPEELLSGTKHGASPEDSLHPFLQKLDLSLPRLVCWPSVKSCTLDFQVSEGSVASTAEMDNIVRKLPQVMPTLYASGRLHIATTSQVAAGGRWRIRLTIRVEYKVRYITHCTNWSQDSNKRSIIASLAETSVYYPVEDRCGTRSQRCYTSTVAGRDCKVWIVFC